MQRSCDMRTLLFMRDCSKACLFFLLCFSHIFCTCDFLSGKNTITLKNRKPLAQDSGSKNGEIVKRKNDGFVRDFEQSQPLAQQARSGQVTSPLFCHLLSSCSSYSHPGHPPEPARPITPMTAGRTASVLLVSQRNCFCIRHHRAPAHRICRCSKTPPLLFHCAQWPQYPNTEPEGNKS